MKFHLTLLTILLFTLSTTKAQRKIYVDSAATGVGNGSSWKHAFTNIHQAIAAASSVHGDSIFVAKGTYHLDPNKILSMKENVKIHGGFIGHETMLAHRNLNAANTSIIKGNENSIFCNSHLSSAAVLDGFTITHSTGIRNTYSSPTFSNCTFLNNRSGEGAAMYNKTSSPHVINCHFIDNTADFGGGAIFNIDNASPKIKNCTFTNNKADDGGAIINIYNSSPHISHCTFADNNAADNGGAIINVNGSNPTISFCTFKNNTSINESGNDIYSEYHSAATIKNCIFNNEATTQVLSKMQLQN